MKLNDLAKEKIKETIYFEKYDYFEYDQFDDFDVGYGQAICFAYKKQMVCNVFFGYGEGDFLVVTTDRDKFQFFYGYYGSCSYCDPFEKEFDNYRDFTEEFYNKLVEFGLNYEPTIEIEHYDMKHILDNNLLESMISKNLQDSRTKSNEDGIEELSLCLLTIMTLKKV